MITLLLLLSSFHANPSHAGEGDLAYFKKFIFQKESVGTDPDFPEFTYHELQMMDLKFTNSRGENVIANGALQLFEDGHTVFVYREMKEMVFPGSPPGTPPGLFPVGCKTFQGKWSVPDTALILSGIGSGVRDFDGTITPPEAVKVSFDQDFLSDGLKGKSATYFYGISNVPNESDFCF